MDALRTRLAERSAAQANGCVLYTGQSNGTYGQIEHRRRTYLAHRASYMVHKGDIPARMCVCHKCDTPLCINPDHLWLGSYSDNTQDMLTKKRDRYNPRTKLTAEQVAEIRASSDFQRDIAARFGISQGMVSMLRNDKRRHAKASFADS